MTMSNKHMPYDLAQMQSLPLEAKIIMTQQRIRQWYEHFEGQVYVGFSGGKDSTVLKHIVDGMYDDVPALFVNTGLEYPEIQRFVKDVKSGRWDCFNTDIEIVRPEMPFPEVLKKYGYPVISKEISQIIREAKIGLSRNDGSYKYRIYRITGKGAYAPTDGKKSRYDCSHYEFMLHAPFDVSEQCCKVMKKQPSRRYARKSGRKPILGTMASESQLRKQRWIKYGCNAFQATGDNQASNPLSFWTEQDILHYIKKFNVPYCSVYGDIVVCEKETEDSVIGQMNIYDALEDYEEAKLETTGCNRTGCIFCMFGCHLEKEPNRFQRLKETHPRQYEYCIGGGEMVEGKWQPNKEGLGLGKVLDYIGVKYD